jgi:hypothetical protein
MPARNIYHESVVHALVNDGWAITHDPLRIAYGGTELYVDLGAERLAIAAERDGRKIAVEIQSFLGPSAVRDLEEAVGQYGVYRIVLAEMDPDRPLYLAVPQHIYDTVFNERFGQLIVSRLHLRLIVFDEEQERITLWIE